MTDELEPAGQVVDADEVGLGESDSVKLVHKSTRVEMHQLHEGPLPAPEDFAQYEKVLPGAAERIMTLTEATIEHRQRMDDQQMDMVGRLADRFLNTALIIGLAVIAAALVIAVLLVIHDEAALGAGIAVVDIIAAAIALTQTSRRKPRPVPGEDDAEG